MFKQVQHIHSPESVSVAFKLLVIFSLFAFFISVVRSHENHLSPNALTFPPHS